MSDEEAEFFEEFDPWDPVSVAYELDFLEKYPHFEERPASIIEFLGPNYLDIEDGMRDGLKDALIEIFGKVSNGEKISIKREAMFTGGIGIGKTTFASIVIPYMLHWVLCLRNPQKFFGLLPGSRIAFMQMSTSDSQAKEVLFGDIKARIDHGKWFQKSGYLPDPKWTSQLRFTAKDLWVLPGNSKETTFEGYNILGGILDEMDSHQVTEQKDYADVGWDTIHERIYSRFQDRGLQIAIGQMKKNVGFAAKKMKEMLENPEAYVARMTIWQSFGWGAYLNSDGTHDSFWYDIKRKTVVPNGVVELIDKSESIIEIPNVYKRGFEMHPEKALRDQAGIPPATGDPFISMVDLVEECSERWAESHPGCESPVNDDPIMPKFQKGWRATDSLKRVLHLDIAYCTDIATEILTRRGWLSYDQIVAGDETLTINDKTHIAEWQQIDSVNIFAAKPRRMLSIEGADHSSLTTGDHRWLTSRRKWNKETRRYDGRENTVVRSTELNGRDDIPLISPVVNLPQEQKYKDSFVELVAWYWTEGHAMKYRDKSESDYVIIYQSHVVNPDNCTRIRAALTATFDDSEWTEVPLTRKTEFRIKSSAGATLNDVAPGKIVNPEFISSLTKSQLDLFVKVSMLADNNGEYALSQRSKYALDSFQMALTLSGVHSGMSSEQDKAGMWYCGIHKTNYMKVLPKHFDWIYYDQEVWCPTTQNGSWLARRNGKIYFTGNSAEGDAAGLAMAHVDRLIEVDGELKPNIVFDFLMRVKAAPGREIIIGDLRRYIYQLKDDLGFKLVKVTMDGFQCFTEDTEVPLLDGRTLTMKELSEQYPDGGVYTYSYDHSKNKICAGKVTKAWKTGIRKTIKVTLDNDEVVTCTPDHRFMLRNGEYKEARLLKRGDSLMPLYRRIVTTDTGHMDNYEQIAQTSNVGTLAWKYTHRVIAGSVPDGYVTHHKDHDHFNNSPENLEVTSRSEHQSHHNLKKFWTDERRKSVGQAVGKENSERLGELAHRRRHDVTIEDLESVVHLTRRQVTSLYGWSQDMIYSRVREAGYRGWKDFRDDHKFNNHKVASVDISCSEYQDVYDLQVEEYSNFAIAAGVLVHNSTDTRQQLQKRRFATEWLSVDKELYPYHDLREAIYERRIEFPKYLTYVHKGDAQRVEIAYQELIHLEDKDGKKIDHPPGGSKDVTDCMAGCAYTLMGDRKYRRGVSSRGNSSLRPAESIEQESWKPRDHDPLGGMSSGMGLKAPVPPVSSLGGLSIPTRGPALLPKRS